MSQPRKVEFEHGTWWLRYVSDRCLPEGTGGTCDPATKKGRKWIYVSAALDDLEELETVIHEVTHAADQRASEEAVEEFGHVLAQLLWNMGWRKSG